MMISWDVWDSLRADVVLLACLFWGFRIIINKYPLGLSSVFVGRYEDVLSLQKWGGLEGRINGLMEPMRGL